MTERQKKGTLPHTYWFVLLLAAIALHFLLPLVQLIDWPYRWIGVLLILLSGWMTIWADQIFKRRKTTIKSFDKPLVMVTDGPFRISRHPIYLFMTTILLGVAVLLGSLTAFIAPVAMFFIFQMIFIPLEERLMEETFGQEYRDYKKRVRKWI